MAKDQDKKRNKKTNKPKLTAKEKKLKKLAKNPGALQKGK